MPVYVDVCWCVAARFAEKSELRFLYTAAPLQKGK